MPQVRRKYPKTVLAEHGDTIFKKSIHPHLKPEDNGKFLAIDMETGAYAIDSDEMKVVRQLQARVPKAQILLRRTDSRYLRHFGRAIK